MQRICVYCGSSPGHDGVFAAAAEALADAFLARGLGLVYGGAGIGLMGAVARRMLKGGGEVIGVIPHGLMRREIALSALEDLRVVESMHERKALMAELADGFVALPGGLGTLEELFEILTWAQLGIHDKPCGLLNVAGYYTPLLQFLSSAQAHGFVRQQHLDLLLDAETPERLLTAFAAFEPPPREEWLDLSRS